MATNKQVIETFYSAFQKLNYSAMQDCYADHPVFNDPVFGILEGEEVKGMWEMLCRGAKDFSLVYSNINLLDEEYATCNWTAKYTFSKTGRRVTNEIKAYMRIQDGKITEHTDYFDFWKWSRQAIGVMGWLLGWSGYLKNKVRSNALRNLHLFLKNRSS
jgi:ketosteroid isomerase-like protein